MHMAGHVQLTHHAVVFFINGNNKRQMLLLTWHIGASETINHKPSETQTQEERSGHCNSLFF